MILVGKIAAEPEYLTSKGGKAYAKFKIKVSSVTGRDNSGKLKFETVWLNSVCFGKTAEFMQKMEVQEKDRVYLEGRFSVSAYDGNDGKKRYWQQVICDEVVPLKEKKEEVLDSPEGFSDDFAQSEDDLPF